MITAEASPASFIKPSSCCNRQRITPIMTPIIAPIKDINNPSVTKMLVIWRLVAPRLRKVEILSSFSMIRSESELITLNDAITRMNDRSRKVTHFSTFIIL